jgi:murein DD-endopeptidase MepM/ murein hydrolase activator NlpD
MGAAVAAAAFAAMPGTALADGSGGASATAPPAVSAIACRSACAAGGATPGALLRLRGSGLARVARIVFLGAPGARDDVAAAAIRPRDGTVDVRVPAGAATGPVQVSGADGTSRPTRPYAIVALARSAPSLAPLPAPAPVHGAHLDALLSGAKVIFDTTQPAQLSYVVTDPADVEVSVDVVRLADGVAVAHWPAVVAAPQARRTVTWNGLAGSRVAAAGRYAFRVFASAPGSPASAAQAQAPDAVQPFDFVPTVFPIQGPHQFGDGIARFGAVRQGHIHQGQDVFAACGTPLVAAQGGVVKFQAFQSRAGNYVVIDPDGTGPDMAYMHLRDRALVHKGDRVATGQPIGFVGRTGDATACHLHFELWTAPGWYTGGHPIDPLPVLRSWDAPAGAAARTR